MKRRLIAALILASATLTLVVGALLVGHFATPPSARLVNSCLTVEGGQFCLGKTLTSLPPPDRSGPAPGDRGIIYQYELENSYLTAWASDGTVHRVTQQVPRRLRQGRASRVQIWLARLALEGRALRSYGPSLPACDTSPVPEQCFKRGRAWQINQTWHLRDVQIELVAQELAPPVLIFSLADRASNQGAADGPRASASPPALGR